MNKSVLNTNKIHSGVFSNEKEDKNRGTQEGSDSRGLSCSNHTFPREPVSVLAFSQLLGIEVLECSNVLRTFCMLEVLNHTYQFLQIFVKTMSFTVDICFPSMITASYVCINNQTTKISWTPRLGQASASRWHFTHIVTTWCWRN